MSSKIKCVTPVALLDVIETIGPGFEQETGHRLELSIMLNPEVPAFIQSGADWSLAASNPWHLEEIPAKARGPIQALGRSPLAFGALGDGGAPVGDDAGISDVLRRSTRIGVTGTGTSGKTFARLLERLALTDEVQDRIIPLKGGEPMRQLLAGHVDLAVLPLTNIAPIRGVRPIAVCPWDLDVHIDLALCCHPEASAEAHMFADWLLSNDRDETLEAL
ncbi:MAG: substrate-binding domain-containing protein, partial [Pseudomonadota bacterium]